MAEVLGKKMDLKAFYPDRDRFHVSEVVGFYKAAVMYFCAIHNLEAAEERYEILKEIAPDSVDMKEASDNIMLERLRRNRLSLKEEKNKIKIITPKLPRKGQKNSQPDFIHNQVHWLYGNDFSIDRSKLEIIMALPRTSLVKDLETILRDAGQRYSFFSKVVEESGWDDNTMLFPVHALFLLGELRATESLPVIFEFLSQHEDVLEFWLSDLLSEIAWEPIYYLIENDISGVNEFLLRPGIYTYSKAAVVSAFSQTVLHHAERKEEAIEFFNGLFTELAATGIDQNLIDSDFIAFAICDATDTIDPELLPAIKPLFDMDYVSTGICGAYDELVKDVRRHDRRIPIKPLMNIYDRYVVIAGYWNNYDEDDSDDDESDLDVISPDSYLPEDEMDYGIPATHHATYINTEPFIAPPKTG